MQVGKKIRRSLVAAAIATASVVGVGIATAAPAQASTNYIWPINHTQVCNWQGHFGATSFNWANPYSLYCYDVSVPAGITITGGLDMNGYCQAKYPGSHSELWGNTIWAWKCVKRVP